MSQQYLIIVAICIFPVACGVEDGVFILDHPIDISNECAFSEHLRYDLSFGMGMSDTITLVFRTLKEIDYACSIEIVTQRDNNVFLVVVIKFPTIISRNCHANRDAFSLLNKNKCYRLCDLVGSRKMESTYFTMTVKGKVRFKFLSNSSINSDIGANLYQVTVTTARLQPPTKCNRKNETLCSIDQQDFCFTSFVVCDGIKNCGVSDWFDERQSKCGLTIEYLTTAPVIAVVAALAGCLLAAGHILLRCLPPLANSFFIFNANEDNRFCIDPVFKAPAYIPFEMDRTTRRSIIPVSSSSSSELTTIVELDGVATKVLEQDVPSSSLSANDTQQGVKRKSTMKSMTAKLQETFRSVTERGKILRASLTGGVKHVENETP